MTQRCRVKMITVVWGDWHLSAYYDLNLATLFAPNNLPEFVRQHDLSCEIYTRAADVGPIQAAPQFQRLAAMVPTEIKTIPDSELDDPIRAHREVWLRAIEQAKADGSMVMLMPPDVGWADGAFAHLANQLSAGKKVIFNIFLRVVSDTFCRELFEAGASGGTIAMAPRDMVRLALRHTHPLMMAYFRDSQYFPHHPEMIMWPVPGEGILIRVLAREVLIFDAAHYQLNDRALLGDPFKPEELHYAGDSDDCFGVSLARLGKDLEWHSVHRILEPMAIARWWLHFDSPVNDLVSAAKIRIHAGEPTPALWRPREAASDVLIRRLAGMREGLRAWRAMHEMGCQEAARIVALAMHTQAIAHILRTTGNAVILVPSNQAIRSLAPDTLDALLGRGGDHKLEDLVRAHVAIEPLNAPDFASRVAAGGDFELRTEAGQRLVVSRAAAAGGLLAGRRAPRLSINGLAVTGEPRRQGRHVLVGIDGILAPPARARAAAAPSVHAESAPLPAPAGAGD